MFGKVINHHRPARILTSFISFQTFKGVDRLPIVCLPCDIDIAPAKQGSPSKTLRPPVHVGLQPHLASRGHLVLQPSHVWPHCNWLQCHSTIWPHFVSRSPSSQRRGLTTTQPDPRMRGGDGGRSGGSRLRRVLLHLCGHTGPAPLLTRTF